MPKILLDECVTKKVKLHLTEFAVSTVREQGWLGFKNGALMKVASDSGFEIFLTIDKNLQFQQAISSYQLAVVILDSPSSKIEIIVPYLKLFVNGLSSFQKGRAYLISI